MIIELLSHSDIPDAIGLVEIAGWNQTPADWRRIITYQPDGCFKAIIDGRVVGTVTNTAYDNSLGWIGMMLVHPDYRRQGVGAMLMQNAINYLQSRNIDCISLDATPMGLPVYENLGFQALYSYHRWCRLGHSEEKNKDLRIDGSINANISNQHFEHDRKVFKYDRRSWLESLAADSAVVITGNGFGMIRRGRIANYLGPIVAENTTEGIGIANRLLEFADGDVFLDYPGKDHKFLEWLSDHSFSSVRTLHRMWLGSKPVEAEIHKQFAISDPATG
ncbi:MAG: GNAT family N-acetyltransferase [bacterium]